MRELRCLLFLLAVLSALAALPVRAQEQSDMDADTVEMMAPGEQEKNDAFILRIETAYQDAIAGLDDNQLIYLQKLEEDERMISQADAEVIRMVGVVKNCVDFDREIGAQRDAYNAAFRRLKAIKQAERRALQMQHDARKSQATFIDRKILNDHLQTISLAAINQIATTAIAEAETMNCEDMEDVLAHYNILPGGMSQWPRH